MEWIERLNATINYIEEKLASEIDYEQIAKIACCSVYTDFRIAHIDNG